MSNLLYNVKLKNLKERVNETFWGDVCVEMEEWCECEGMDENTYKIENLDSAWFSNSEDANAFVGKFGLFDE